MTSRVAFVTGGSGAVGSAIVRALVAAGHAVAFTYHESEEDARLLAKSVAEERGYARGLDCDVTDWGAIDRAFDHIEGDLGPVEILVNAAGVCFDRPLPAVSADQWEVQVQVNLGASLAATRRASRELLRRSWGRIVNVGSVSGALGIVGQAVYASTKAGLTGLTRVTARELASRNVTCNLLSVGPLEGGMTSRLSAPRIADITAQVPLGRLGTPEEVGAVCTFLCSDSAAYITGAVIPVDGGVGMAV